MVSIHRKDRPELFQVITARFSQQFSAFNMVMSADMIQRAQKQEMNSFTTDSRAVIANVPVREETVPVREEANTGFLGGLFAHCVINVPVVPRHETQQVQPQKPAAPLALFSPSEPSGPVEDGKATVQSKILSVLMCLLANSLLIVTVFLLEQLSQAAAQQQSLAPKKMYLNMPLHSNYAGTPHVFRDVVVPPVNTQERVDKGHTQIRLSSRVVPMLLRKLHVSKKTLDVLNSTVNMLRDSIRHKAEPNCTAGETKGVVVANGGFTKAGQFATQMVVDLFFLYLQD